MVEAVHVAHAVAVEDGRVTEYAGNPGLLTFYRSSSKPIQALPLARERDDIDERELAIACASHRAEPAQLEAVASLLTKAPATEDDLECGLQEGRPQNRLAHNCSGKHAGFLAVCRARDWPTEGYRLPSHPLQRLLHHEVAVVADISADEIPAAVDGCGVLTFGMTLEQMAGSFARLRQVPGGERVCAAMSSYPELIGYERGAADTDLMRRRPGWVAKGGAEGLICAASPEGLGIAIKVEDGNMRALRPALAAFLGLGEDFAVVPIENGHGEVVGEIACEQGS